MSELYDEILLLDYIEGELGEAGELKMEQLLDRDPRLGELLEQMKRDRVGLRALEEPEAPDWLMDEVDRQLERSMLVDSLPHDGEAIVIRQRHMVRRLAMVGSLAAMITVVVTLVISSLTGNPNPGTSVVLGPDDVDPNPDADVKDGGKDPDGDGTTLVKKGAKSGVGLVNQDDTNNKLVGTKKRDFPNDVTPRIVIKPLVSTVVLVPDRVVDTMPYGKGPLKPFDGGRGTGIAVLPKKNGIFDPKSGNPEEKSFGPGVLANSGHGHRLIPKVPGDKKDKGPVPAVAKTEAELDRLLAEFRDKPDSVKDYEIYVVSGDRVRSGELLTGLATKWTAIVTPLSEGVIGKNGVSEVVGERERFELRTTLMDLKAIVKHLQVSDLHSSVVIRERLGQDGKSVKRKNGRPWPSFTPDYGQIIGELLPGVGPLEQGNRLKKILMLHVTVDEKSAEKGEGKSGVDRGKKEGEGGAKQGAEEDKDAEKVGGEEKKP